MNDENKLCLILVIILIFVVCNDNYPQIYDYFTTKNVISGVDQNMYKVVGGFDNPNEAADKMASIHTFMIDFMRFLKKKFIIEKKGTYQEKEFVRRILNKYRPDTLRENDPMPGQDTSYVLNKGDQFGLCLRKKKGADAGEFHNMGIIKFVALHEITHLGCTTFGHGPEFWTWFKFILIQSKESGLYNPVDYRRYPQSYCGIMVSHNPYFT